MLVLGDKISFYEQEDEVAVTEKLAETQIKVLFVGGDDGGKGLRGRVFFFITLVFLIFEDNFCDFADYS